MQKKERFTARKLAIAGLLSALVFVSSWMQIEVGPARFHLGNGIFWARWQAVLLILCCTWQNRLWKCIG